MTAMPVKKIAPQRIQLKRTKGFNLQRASANLNGLAAIKCARPSMYGNPFKVGALGVPDNQEAVKRFRRMVSRADIGDSHTWFVFSRERIRQDLRGINLACWCRLDEPCHVDVILEIANE